MNVIIELINEINPYCTVKKDTELIEEGILSSLAIMTLINLIESRYDITIADEDVIVDNFRTLVEIKDLIRKYCESEA